MDRAMKCPRCRSAKLWKSRRGNARLVFPLPLFVISIRCHHCGKRYLHFGLLPGRGIPQAEEPLPAKSA
jgi:hypothetical protein